MWEGLVAYIILWRNNSLLGKVSSIITFTLTMGYGFPFFFLFIKNLKFFVLQIKFN